MPFQPVAGAIEIVVKASIGSIPFVNVFGVLWDFPLTEEVADDTAAFLVSCYERFDEELTDQFHLTEMIVTDLKEETGAQFTISGDPDLVTGGNSANALPFQAAALVSWHTPTRGRSYRGRSYIGGFCENGSDGRNIASGVVTKLQLFANDIADNGAFGVISRYHGVDEDGHPIPREEGLITAINDATVHTQWRTQRRRALFSD